MKQGVAGTKGEETDSWSYIGAMLYVRDPIKLHEIYLVYGRKRKQREVLKKKKAS
jgi:hypothetical protein